MASALTESRAENTGRNIEVEAPEESGSMKAKSAKKKVTDEEYYDKRSVLGEIVESEVALALMARSGRTSSR